MVKEGERKQFLGKRQPTIRKVLVGHSLSVSKELPYKTSRFDKQANCTRKMPDYTSFDSQGKHFQNIVISAQL